MKTHPIQPLVKDDRGVLRFKPNKIVQYLLDHGGIDMNELAVLDFEREDREQFAQLIGYSHGGAGELGYFSNEVWVAAFGMLDGTNEHEARADVLRDQLEEARDGMRAGVAALFGKHEDDLP